MGGVRGIVRDREGQGVAGAIVMVANIEKNVTTSEKGEYWRILAPGTYRLDGSILRIDLPPLLRIS